MTAGGKEVAHYEKEQVWHGIPILYTYIFSCVTSLHDTCNQLNSVNKYCVSLSMYINYI